MFQAFVFQKNGRHKTLLLLLNLNTQAQKNMILLKALDAVVFQ